MCVMTVSALRTKIVRARWPTRVSTKSVKVYRSVHSMQQITGNHRKKIDTQKVQDMAGVCQPLTHGCNVCQAMAALHVVGVPLCVGA